jgi:hypothetical protein
MVVGVLGLEDARDLLGPLVAVARAERTGEPGLELARRCELLDDVGAADQLALDEDLGDGRPAGDRGELLPDCRVGEDVDGGDGRARLAQGAQGAGRSFRT